MKRYALAIGLAAALLSTSAAYADHQNAFYNAEDGRPAYYSDHVATNRHRLENVQGAMKSHDAQVRHVKSFSAAERKWFNQSNPQEYGNCGAPTTWPCN